MSNTYQKLAQFDPKYDCVETTPRVKYLILSEARSGSTMLSSALQASGIAGVPMEYFHPDAASCLPQPITEKVVVQYITDLESRRTTPNGIFGIKLQLQQFKRFFVRDNRLTGYGARYLRSFDKCIILNRKDRLAQAISFVEAKKRGMWNSEKKIDERAYSSSFTTRETELVLYRLLAATKTKRTWENLSNSLKINSYHTDYEMLVDDWPTQIKLIMGHLGLRPLSYPEPTTVKLAADDHHDAKIAFLSEIGIESNFRTR
jgi:LPS sulfotransferase NodH|tara:strand:- start:304 stop:1083 length:780 start_codon:yes stop_codon:yes gene_type:complete